MPIIDAVVMAGGVPGPDEPLYPLTQGRPKALLPLAGRVDAAFVSSVDAPLLHPALIERVFALRAAGTSVRPSTNPPTEISSGMIR